VTERRATLTLNWRPIAPAQRVDDFLEVAPAPAPVEAKPERQVERRSIGRRLENWGMWANASPSRGGGSDNMTAVICENMRRHAVGELHPPAPVNDRIDTPDAELINRAFVKLPDIHRGVLHWTYVVCAKPRGVAGACGFPSAEYGVRLGDAQAAIEAVVGGVGEPRTVKSAIQKRPGP
jgi:hypothetical protein